MHFDIYSALKMIESVIPLTQIFLKEIISSILKLYVPSCLLALFIIVKMEKAMAPHSSILAWKIPWTEEPGRLESMGSQRVGHDWATSLSLFHFHALEKEMATHSCSCLENPRDGGAWWAAVYGVAQSRTRLKWLSSSSSIIVKNGTLPKCAAVEE